jgi:hypothetical protein
MCNTTKIENLNVIEPIPASFPCVLAKENNTVVTAICRDLGAKRLVKYLTDWIGQLSYIIIRCEVACALSHQFFTPPENM